VAINRCLRHSESAILAPILGIKHAKDTVAHVPKGYEFPFPILKKLAGDLSTNTDHWFTLSSIL
jgi:hypothetical protein